MISGTDSRRKGCPSGRTGGDPQPVRSGIRRLIQRLGILLAILALALLAGLAQSSAAIAADHDRTLEEATAEALSLAEELIRSGTRPQEALRMAVEEVSGPGRRLHLFGPRVEPIVPPRGSAAVLRWSALEAHQAGIYRRHYAEAGAAPWSVYAQRYEVPEGGNFVVVAVADAGEVVEQQAALIHRYIKLLLLLLIPVGGYGLFAGRGQRMREINARRLPAPSCCALEDTEYPRPSPAPDRAAAA